MSTLLGLAPMMFGMEEMDKEDASLGICILKLTHTAKPNNDYTCTIRYTVQHEDEDNNAMSFQTKKQLYNLSKILKPKNKSQQANSPTSQIAKTAQVFISNPKLKTPEVTIVVNEQKAILECKTLKKIFERCRIALLFDRHDKLVGILEKSSHFLATVRYSTIDLNGSSSSSSDEDYAVPTCHYCKTNFADIIELNQPEPQQSTTTKLYNWSKAFGAGFIATIILGVATSKMGLWDEKTVTFLENKFEQLMNYASQLAERMKAVNFSRN